MENERIFLSTPTMHGEEKEFIKEAFDTNWIAPLGKNVDEFEKELASYVGISNAAALASGTSALHLAAILSHIKQDDIVFCSDLTFSATVNPVSYEKGRQVFIDSERDTWNMDPKALEKAFEKYPNPRAVIIVNLYGVPAKLDEIRDICKRHNTILIEDAAESLGATYKGKQTGTFGEFGVFSFNGNKIITTSGGGMLVSEDENMIKKARFLATQAREPFPYYQHEEIGYNYRMSNVVAGIGRGQLIHLDEHKAKKEEIYNIYKEGLSNLPLTMNPYPDCSEPNFWLSCILIDKDCKVKPLDIIKKLGEHNIEARHIWKPMHMQPVFDGYDYICCENDSVSEDIFQRGVCLPSDIKMTSEQQKRVIEIIKECFYV